MLRLEKLELSGFKSFVDPVSVEFKGGIIAVVGPNGCGKSNLSDAITWVLGEQSAKMLRGGKMQDFIFNGSAQRKPVGMAEAVLTLAGDGSHEGVDDGRLTIGRRVLRSGESQYRLNGKVARLKDVKDLLMDTGLGIRAYSVIEQGRIGMILSGKPQERRKLIEEAAGITRYKARKRIAEIKLEEATANLLRLDDIVSEVERSLRSLKRQAGAARRYKEREEQYRELLDQVLCARWGNLSTRLSALTGQLEASTASESELAAGLSRGEAELAEGRERLEELAREVAERHERHSELAATVEGRQEFLKAARASETEIAERIAGGRASVERREQEIERATQAKAEAGEKRQALLAELSQAETRVGEDEEAIASAEERLAEAGRRSEGLRGDLLTAAAELTNLTGRLHQHQIELEKGTYKKNHLADEIQRHQEELSKAEGELTTARDAATEIERQTGEMTEERARLAARLDDLMEQEAAANEKRQSTEKALSEARQRQALLTELAQAHAERRSALETLLEEAGLTPRFLSDRIAAATGWERSLDFYLGALADAVVLEAGEDPLALGATLARGRSTAALLAPIEDARPVEVNLDDPAVGLPLGNALGLPDELASALPPAFLVEAPDGEGARHARRLAAQHPGVAFLCSDGLWAHGGLVHVEGDEVRPGLLEREAELAELEENLPRIERELGAAVARVGELVKARTECAGAANRMDSALGELRQKQAVARARLADLESRHRRLATEHTTLHDESGEIEREIARLNARRESLASEQAAAEERHGRLTEGFDASQSEVDKARGERQELRAETAGRKGQLDVLRERLAAHDRETHRLDREIEQSRQQMGAWRDEAEKLAHRRAQVQVDIDKADDELAVALEQRASLSDQILEAQARLDGHRANLRSQEEQIASTRERRDQVRNAVEALRIEEAGLKQDAGHLAETYRESFDRELPAEPEAPDRELSELETDMARLKDMLDRMGPVNLVAEQEYTETEERQGFLVEQRADVVESIESLRRTIKEINETSSARFAETFKEVNKTFGELFTDLFRGGEAEMRLMDEEDVLESGIEIVARPPGKRLQNIMLLSGGEKALTAIALLMALFRTKPSPFCILDEVDAPLDDPNVIRFVALLEKMAKDTQFIVITHNKLTMNVAHTLYGVTMEERGVSKVVSVELDDVQPLEDTQAATA